jgi:CubicO group peptidase (beta-lactamase class C family)
MKLFTFLLLPLFFSCTAQTASETEKKSKVDSIIKQVISEYQIPGVSVAFLYQGTNSLIISKEYTKDKLAPKITDTTLFSAQSISKTITSLACLRAVRDGLLDLDVPITNYIPNFRVNSIYEDKAFSIITLRHLLSHTSGLPPDAPIGNNFTSVFKSEVYAPLEQRVGSLEQVWLRNKVGAQYSYSNVAFDLVARIIELTSGKSFHQFVRLKVLVPLGMKYSTLDLDTIQYLSNVAQGHCYNFDGIVPVKFSSIGAGGLYTCPKDMISFLQSALKGFPEILDDSLYKEFTTIPFSNETSGYALGLTVNDFQYCTPAFGHTGNGFGFTSLMFWVPAFEIGISILCNRESAYTGLQRIQQALLSEYGSLDKINLPCQRITNYNNYFNKEESEYFQKLSGDYSNGNTTLTFETRDSLFGVLAPDDGSFKTIHFLTKNRWLIEDNEIIQFSYKNGQIINLNNGMSFRKIIIIAPNDELEKADWNKYTGRYRSYAYGILESTEIIDLENGFLRLNGNPLREYYPGLFFDQFGQIVDFRSDTVRIEYGDYEKID